MGSFSVGGGGSLGQLGLKPALGFPVPSTGGTLPDWLAQQGGQRINEMPIPRQPPQGVTRRGSQMIDAQGNVVGHYGNNNEPIYNGGQGPMGPGGPIMDTGPFGGVPPGWQSSDNGPALTPEQRRQQGLPPLGGSIPGPAPGFDEWMRQQQRLPPHRLGDPVASTSMGMDPRYVRGMFGPGLNDAYAKPQPPNGYGLSDALGPGGFWGKFRPQVQAYVNRQTGNYDPTQATDQGGWDTNPEIQKYFDEHGLFQGGR